MIPVPSGVRVWLATGVTDMRRGMNTLALQVQQDLGGDPHAGDLYVFRGRRGDLDPSRKSGGALHRLHCFCLEFDGACEVQRRVPTEWIIEPIDVSGYGSFSLAS